MADEIFYITVNGIDLKIITSLPVGPDAVDHEVYKRGELLFKINPRLNKSDEPAWELTDEYKNHGIDKEFISQIGEQIERHYL